MCEIVKISTAYSYPEKSKFHLSLPYHLCQTLSFLWESPILSSGPSISVNDLVLHFLEKMKALRREFLHFFSTKPISLPALSSVSHPKERAACRHEELREPLLPYDKPSLQT